MFIQTESTPNPASLKFLPGRDILPSGTADFPNAEAAVASPLARRLFAIECVVGVFIGGDFITVTKGSDKDWSVIKPMILGAIMDHCLSGEAVFDEIADDTAASNHQADSEVVRQIKELLDTRVRPAVARDGGDIVFGSFENGVVYLKMRGACAGCPSSIMTLKHGVENMLRHFIPEVIAVEATQ